MHAFGLARPKVRNFPLITKQTVEKPYSNGSPRLMSNMFRRCFVKM